MPYHGKTTRIITIVCMILFIIAGIIHKFPTSPTISDFPVIYISMFTYIGIITVWAVSVFTRIINKNARIYMFLSACMMVLWYITAAMKYRFFDYNETVKRYCWYFYYVPIVLLPVFLFCTALGIGKRELSFFSNRRNLIFIPACALILGVLSNDFHELAFNFADASDYREYSYGPVYYAVFAFAAMLIIVSLAIIFYKCRVLKSRKSVWAPLCVLIMFFIYILYTLTETYLTGTKMYTLTDIYSFMILSFLESCIQTGLIPSNSGYREFFSVSSVDVGLAKQDGTVIAGSQMVKNIAPKTVLVAARNPIMLDENMRLTTFPIDGGYACYLDDLSVINKVNNELSEVKDRLSEYNLLISEESKLRREYARVFEKNRIYDRIATMLMPEFEKINALIEKGERFSYAKACVIAAYVKRRSNLSLLADAYDTMEAFELESSIKESLEYIELCVSACAFERNVTGCFSSDLIIHLYDSFEKIAENILSENTTRAVLVNMFSFFDRDEKGITLKITFDSKSPDKQVFCRTVNDGGIKKFEKREKEEDGTVFVTLSFSERGVEL